MATFSKGTASVIRIMKWFFPASLLIVLCVPVAHAQGTYAAASCNQSDVNAVINGPTHTAINSDTINIPAGTCTWTSGITIPAGIGISIIGAGASSTIINDSGVASPGLFYAQPTYGNALMRISGMTLQPATSTSPYSPIMIIGTCTSSGCPNIRVDNMVFPSTWQGTNLQDAQLLVVDNCFGVLDHNTVTGVAGSSSGVGLVNVNFSAWRGVGQYGDNSWASPDTYGTNQALYIENNTFTSAFAEDTDSGSTYVNTGGARFVCRFNTFNSVTLATACTNHGTETTGRPRGGRQMEAYNNTLTCTSSNGCAGFGIRSGPALIFNNALTAESGSWFNGIVTPLLERSSRGPATPWGTCDGTGGYDLNDGVIYGTGTVTTSGTSTFSDSAASWTTNEWAGSAVTNGVPYSVHDVTQNFGDEITANTATQYTFVAGPCASNSCTPFTWNTSDSYQISRATVCIDQPGRGQSNYISGTTPTTGWVNNALDPMYEWADTYSGTFAHTPVYITSTNRILINRDYYNQVSQSAQTSSTSPFNGTVGTGFGTLANRPATCTTGVAYWATDQGSWNTSGSGGQGVLYICGASGWPSSPSYTPYTYPHPLTGCPASSSSPAPPCGLTATPVPAQ